MWWATGAATGQHIGTCSIFKKAGLLCLIFLTFARDRDVDYRRTLISVWGTIMMLLAGIASAHSSSFPSQAIASSSAITAALNAAADSPQCRAIEPYYWEIGDRERVWVSGMEGADAPDAHTDMPIASASKWIFAAYVLEKRQGRLSAADIDALTMRSGYTSFALASCIRALPARRRSQTVSECASHGDNARFTLAHQGRFFYNGGHFQQLGVQALGLGALNNEALAAEFRQTLGVTLAWGSPQLAGGLRMSAADYAEFLRALLTGKLRLGEQLGAHAVCATPGTCKDAIYAPVPADQRWHYSLGHWVETDPHTGDGAFSSAGAFGFYPWIDAHRRFYGVIARQQRGKGIGARSVECGRRMRAAFLQAVH